MKHGYRSLKQRIEALEAEVAELRRRLDPPPYGWYLPPQGMLPPPPPIPPLNPYQDPFLPPPMFPPVVPSTTDQPSPVIVFQGTPP